MKFKIAAIAAAALATTAISPAMAAEISNLTGQNSNLQIAFASPLGQSFTAIDSSLVSIGFDYGVINSFLAPSPLTIDLYVGDGTGGTIIASRTFSLANPNGVFDTDFTGTTLTVGSVYTAALSTSSAYQGLFLTGNNYAGGRAYSPAFGLVGIDGATTDLAFRVIGTSAVAPVPEPASWALMLGGFGAIGGAMRSRRKAAVSFG